MARTRAWILHSVVWIAGGARPIAAEASMKHSSASIAPGDLVVSNNVASANAVYKSDVACAERAGLVSHFLHERLEILVRRAKRTALTGYKRCPALPRKAHPSGCRPICGRREEIIQVCEEGRTCADHIPDTSRTNVRHLLGLEGIQAVVS